MMYCLQENLLLEIGKMSIYKIFQCKIKYFVLQRYYVQDFLHVTLLIISNLNIMSNITNQTKKNKYILYFIFQFTRYNLLIKYSTNNIDMLRSNTNIIGYLQKKAFFTKSPSPSPSPSPNSRFTTSPVPHRIKVTPPKHNNYFTNSSSKGSINTFHRTVLPVNQQSKVIYNVSHSQAQQSDSFQKTRNKAKIYTKNPFQSSRIQLIGRITAELRMLQGAITELTVSLESLFYRKLHELKQQLLQNVQNIFAKAKNNLSNMLNKNSEDHLNKLLKARHSLSQEDQRLKKLKSGMESGWRKVAGELFMEEYDQKIERLLQDSEVARKEVKINRRQMGQSKEQSAWQTVQKCVSSLIQRRCG